MNSSWYNRICCFFFPSIRILQDRIKEVSVAKMIQKRSYWGPFSHYSFIFFPLPLIMSTSFKHSIPLISMIRSSSFRKYKRSTIWICLRLFSTILSDIDGLSFGRSTTPFEFGEFGYDKSVRALNFCSSLIQHPGLCLDHILNDQICLFASNHSTAFILPSFSLTINRNWTRYALKQTLLWKELNKQKQKINI